MEVERIQDSIKRNYDNVFSRNRKNKNILVDIGLM